MLYMPEPDTFYLDKMTGEKEPLPVDFNGMCSLEKFYTDPKAADGNSYRLQLWMYAMRLLQYSDAIEHLLTTGVARSEVLSTFLCRTRFYMHVLQTFLWVKEILQFWCQEIDFSKIAGNWVVILSVFKAKESSWSDRRLAISCSQRPCSRRATSGRSVSVSSPFSPQSEQEYVSCCICFWAPLKYSLCIEGVEHYNEIRNISICEFLPPHLTVYVDVPSEEVQKRLQQSGKVAKQHMSSPTLI